MLNIYIMLLPLQGVTNERTLTQGVASLALGYVLLPFQGVHYWMQNHDENIMDFEHPTPPPKKIIGVHLLYIFFLHPPKNTTCVRLIYLAWF